MNASEDSNFFKINCNKKSETQERREKNRNRKFPQLTTVCQHGHMSYTVLENVSVAYQMYITLKSKTVS